MMRGVNDDEKYFFFFCATFFTWVLVSAQNLLHLSSFLSFGMIVGQYGVWWLALLCTYLLSVHLPEQEA